MKLGHLIYKVDNIQEAVEKWQKAGFVVEYGRAKKPYNAIIYFSEGPYIELLSNTNMPFIIRPLLKLGKGRMMIKRFETWTKQKDRWCELCIEKEPGDLKNEIEILNKYGIDGIYLKNGKRVDTKGRVLKYKCFFPNELKLPFLMSYFETDPKPKNFIHPNGIKKISKVSYRTSDKLIPVLTELLDDDNLELIADNTEYGIVDVEYL